MLLVVLIVVLWFVVGVSLSWVLEVEYLVSIIVMMSGVNNVKV